MERTPIEILAEALFEFDHLENTARKLLAAYDGFLALLADSDRRKHLETLPEGEYEEDFVFQEARRLSHEFREGLVEMFFDERSGLAELTKNYAVF